MRAHKKKLLSLYGKKIKTITLPFPVKLKNYSLCLIKSTKNLCNSVYVYQQKSTVAASDSDPQTI